MTNASRSLAVAPSVRRPLARCVATSFLAAALLHAGGCVEPEAEPALGESEEALDGDPASRSLRDDSYRGRAALRFANTATNTQLGTAGLTSTELATLKKFRNGPDGLRGSADDRFAMRLTDLWFVSSASAERMSTAATALYQQPQTTPECVPTGTVDVTPPVAAFGTGVGNVDYEGFTIDKQGTMWALQASDNLVGGALAVRSASGSWSNVKLPPLPHGRKREIVAWDADEWGVWMVYQVHRPDRWAGDLTDGSYNDKHFGAEYGLLTNWRGTWEDQTLSQPYVDCLEENNADYCWRWVAAGQHSVATFDLDVSMSRGGVATILATINERGWRTSDDRYRQVLRGGTRSPAMRRMGYESLYSTFSICDRGDDEVMVFEDRRLDPYWSVQLLGTIDTVDVPNLGWIRAQREVGGHATDAREWFRGHACASVDGNTIVTWAGDDALHYLIADASGAETTGTFESYVTEQPYDGRRPVALRGLRAGFDLYYTSESTGEGQVMYSRQRAAFPNAASVALTSPVLATPLQDPDGMISMPELMPNGARAYYVEDRVKLETCAP